MMGRQVLFLFTAHLQKLSLLKDCKTLQQMETDSDDIQSHKVFIEYQRRPNYLKTYCLADS